MFISHFSLLLQASTRCQDVKKSDRKKSAAARRNKVALQRQTEEERSVSRLINTESSAAARVRETPEEIENRLAKCRARMAWAWRRKNKNPGH